MDSEKRRYSDAQVEILRETSMVSILAALGYDARRGSNKLYRSPFRDESIGSLHIDDSKHVWCDHGGSDPHTKSGKPGGDTIKFVMELRRCSFGEALDFLSSFNPNIIPITQEERQRRAEENGSSKVSITNVTKLTATSLKEYATSQRRIPLELMLRYCSQVYYNFSGGAQVDGRHDLYAIGFPNRSGGWALRNNLKDRLNKFSTSPSDITVIDMFGNFRNDDQPTSERVIVFEGFFDFLSWMAWNGLVIPSVEYDNGEIRGNDIVVLNSTSNLAKGLDYIVKHDIVLSILDNDATGRKHSVLLEQACRDAEQKTLRGKRYIDSSSSLDPGQDFADAWVKECRREEVREFANAQEITEEMGMHR